MIQKLQILIQLKTDLSTKKKTEITALELKRINSEIDAIDDIISDLRKLETLKKKPYELMEKLVLRGCFRGKESSDGRNYSMAKTTFNEITHLHYEDEVDKQ